MGCSGSKGTAVKEDERPANTDFITTAVEGNLADDAVVLVSKPTKLKDDKDAVLQAVRLAPRAIRMADSKYLRDKEIMLIVGESTPNFSNAHGSRHGC